MAPPEAAKSVPDPVIPSPGPEEQDESSTLPVNGDADDDVELAESSFMSIMEEDVELGPSATLTENNEELLTVEEVKALKSLEKSAQRAARKRAWRSRKLLFIYIFITSLCCGALVVTKWVLHYRTYGYPPTDFAFESTHQTVLSGIGLAVLALFGLILLVFRISNIFIGMVFMFLLVLVGSFGMKTISRSYYSILTDKETYLPLFIKSMYTKERVVPDFYNKVQQLCECCGFDAIDRLADWPSLTNSPDFPESCCKPETKKNRKDQRCNKGKGLGWAHNQTKVLSGFRVIASRSFMTKWGSNSKEIPYKISSFQKDIIGHKNVEELNKRTNEAATGLVDQITKNQTTLFFSGSEKKYLTAFGSIPVEVVRLLELFYDYAKYKNRTKAQNNANNLPVDWVEYTLPLGGSNAVTFVSVGKAVNESGILMYFVTRGLVENVVLDPYFWMRRCQSRLKDFTKGHECRAEKSWPTTSMTSPKDKEGVFLSLVKRLMLWNGAMATGVVILSILIAIIFWYFYSKLKSDEQADLALPTDFDLLRLDLPSYDELDEATKALEKEVLKQRVEEQKARLSQERKKKAGPLVGKWRKSAILKPSYKQVGPEYGRGRRQRPRGFLQQNTQKDTNQGKKDKSRVRKEGKITSQKNPQPGPYSQKDKDKKAQQQP